MELIYQNMVVPCLHSGVYLLLGKDWFARKDVYTWVTF